jgi:23S rRNA (guanosine2251-2'-O)-methyltransferase
MPASDRKLTMDELGRLSTAEYAHAVNDDLVVVLDNVRSRHNVGSLFRTADSFGVGRMVLCGFTPCPPHREIEKTALGATDSVPWEHFEDTTTAVERLKTQGYRVVAVEQTVQAVPFTEVIPSEKEKIALVLGNELSGVSDEVVQQCDACVVVPQHGSKHSLNVSVCGGLVIWWMAHQRQSVRT